MDSRLAVTHPHAIPTPRTRHFALYAHMTEAQGIDPPVQFDGQELHDGPWATVGPALVLLDQ